MIAFFWFMLGLFLSNAMHEWVEDGQPDPHSVIAISFNVIVIGMSYLYP